MRKIKLFRTPLEIATLLFIGLGTSIIFTPVVKTAQETIDWDKVSIEYVQEKIKIQEEELQEMREKQIEMEKQTKD